MFPRFLARIPYMDLVQMGDVRYRYPPKKISVLHLRRRRKDALCIMYLQEEVLDWFETTLKLLVTPLPLYKYAKDLVWS